MIFPERCPGCDRVHKVGHHGFCEKCEPIIRVPQGNVCPYCGKPLPEELLCCPDCRGREEDGVIGQSAMLYSGMMRDSMARFKAGHRAEYAQTYAEYLWKTQRDFLEQMGDAVLVPVPMHDKKVRKRGYNQAELIAAALAKYCHYPSEKRLLRKIKETKAQKSLAKRERMANLEDAFWCDPEVAMLYLPGKCAIIIDDIYTTGATVQACAGTLRKAGFAKVYFLCVCIGVKV